MADMGGGMMGQISQWAGGGATTTLGAAQTLYGMQQKRKNKRPEYEIPDEVAQGLAMAKQQALQGTPEEIQQRQLSEMQRGQSYALGQASSRKGGLAGLAALNENYNTGLANMAAQSAAIQQQNQGRVYGQLENVANYENQEFQLNQLNPYYEKAAEAEAMIGAGMQNVSQGFQASNTGGNYGTQAQPQAPQAQQQAPSIQQQSSTGINPYASNPNNTYQNPNLFTRPQANPQTLASPNQFRY